MTTPVEVSFPFRIDPSGSIATETNPDQQVANHMIALVGTQPTERVCLSRYGVNTLLSVFEPNDEFIAQQLATTISSNASIFEPGVNVLNVKVNDSVQAIGVVSIDVQYTRVNSGANTPGDPSKIFTATIKTNGDIR